MIKDVHRITRECVKCAYREINYYNGFEAEMQDCYKTNIGGEFSNDSDPCRNYDNCPSTRFKLLAHTVHQVSA